MNVCHILTVAFTRHRCQNAIEVNCIQDYFRLELFLPITPSEFFCLFLNVELCFCSKTFLKMRILLSLKFALCWSAYTCYIELFYYTLLIVLSYIVKMNEVGAKLMLHFYLVTFNSYYHSFFSDAEWKSKVFHWEIFFHFKPVFTGIRRHCSNL